MNKISLFDIGGEVVKDNDVYLLKDNTRLKNLVVSSTTLHPGQETRGHDHPGQEEVYVFVSGQGRLQLIHDDVHVYSINVGPNDVVQIPDGWFHKVYNESDMDLYFVCVFNGKRNH